MTVRKREAFWVSVGSPPKRLRCYGFAVWLPGFPDIPLMVHRWGARGLWRVTEPRTGLKLLEFDDVGRASESGAMEAAARYVSAAKVDADRFRDVIEEKSRG